MAKALFLSDNNTEDKAKTNASTVKSKSYPQTKVIRIQKAVKRFLYSKKRIQIKKYCEDLQVSIIIINNTLY